MEYDRFQRRMGLPFGAQKSLEVMMADPTTRTVLEAYSAGVNAYINSLSAKTLPFEYKLLDYKPEPWQPLKCALLLKLMAWDLSGRSDDLRLSNALNKYGPALSTTCFPSYPTPRRPYCARGHAPGFYAGAGARRAARVFGGLCRIKCQHASRTPSWAPTTLR